MATRNIEPRANGEGAVGSSDCKWGEVNAVNGSFGNLSATNGNFGNIYDKTSVDEALATKAPFSAVGSPLVAANATNMTDHTKVYVYVGSETGYTNGNWYYWNGTAWVSGGVYQATALETDKTLSISGAAADSYVTGQKFELLQANNVITKSLPINNFEIYASGYYVRENGQLEEAPAYNVYKVLVTPDIRLVEVIGSSSSMPTIPGAIHSTSRGFLSPVYIPQTADNTYYLSTLSPLPGDIDYYLFNCSASQGLGPSTVNLYINPNEHLDNGKILCNPEIVSREAYIDGNGNEQDLHGSVCVKINVEADTDYFVKSSYMFYGGCYDEQDNFLGTIEPLSNGTLQIRNNTKYMLVNLNAKTDFVYKQKYLSFNYLNSGIKNVLLDIASNNAWINDKYVDISTGEYVYMPTLSVSRPYDIGYASEISTKFIHDGSVIDHSFVFFDSNMEYVAGFNGVERTIEVPDNAKYVVVNIFTDEINNGINSANHYLKITKLMPEWLGKSTESESSETIHYQESHVHNIINKKMDFDGKKLLAFGDSIMEGYASEPGFLGVIENPWIKQFSQKANCTLVNKAISGTMLTTYDSSRGSILTTVLNTTEAADIIFIAGGTNDENGTNNSPIGTMGETDTTTVYGALQVMCNYLKTNYPNTKVVFITPINRPNVREYGGLKLFEDIRNAIYDVATFNGYSVIDGSELGFPLDYGAYQQKMIVDGLHPSIAGHAMLANAVAGIVL